MEAVTPAVPDSSTIPASTPAAPPPSRQMAPSQVAPPPSVPDEALPPPSHLSLKFRLQHTATEISRLFISRWVGLEGVLAVTSADGLGPDLLERGLLETPGAGVDSLYQRMADSPYTKYDDFVFMTIPGPLAVLMYGGSLAILACGMAGFFVLCYAMERLADVLLRNPATSAVVGVSLAYLLVQLNIPYLQFAFVVELTAALALMGMVRYAAKKLPAWPRPAAER